jgi:peptidyl-prolyl cis-trans isomerase C
MNAKKARTQDAGLEAERQRAVAKVGGRYVTVDELSRRIGEQPVGVRPSFASRERRSDLLNSIVRFELLAQEALESGIDKDADVQRIFKQLIVERLQQREYEPRIQARISEAEVLKYYESHRDELHPSDLVRATEILVSSEARARQVAAAAAKLPAKSRLEGFRGLVRSFSEDAAGKARGGDTGFFDRGSGALPGPVVDATLALGDKGDISPPVRSEKGWHVVQLVDKRPRPTRSKEEAMAEARRRLSVEHRRRIMDDVLAQLRRKFGVELYEDNLELVDLDPGILGGTGQRSPSAPVNTTASAAPAATGR